MYHECICTIAWAYIDYIDSQHILWDLADFLNRVEGR